MTYTIHETTNKHARAWCVLDTEGQPVNGQYHKTREEAERQLRNVEPVLRHMENQRRAG